MASGGAFRTWDTEDIRQAKAAAALRHPNWHMGPKITIDCATLVNKGLELIETSWLFNIPYDKIDILVHPESIIHSMVEFEDGAIMAQMAAPDMRQPIQYALSYPMRLPMDYKPLDFTELSKLTFEAPDYKRFPCLPLIIEAARIGGTAPAMVNYLNEKLVEAYLKDELGFYDISSKLEEALSAYKAKPVTSLDDIDEAEVWVCEFFKNRGA